MDLATVNVTTAATQTTTAVTGLGKLFGLTLQVIFTYVASAATSVKVYVQTSIDGGNTWYDIACFAHTTASLARYAAVVGEAQITPVALTDGTLADNTCAHGLLGDRIRLKVVSVGTYGAGTQVVATYSPR